MVSDYHQWCKEHTGYLYEKTQNLKNDNLLTSPGDIWSLKKLLFLDYYIAGFVKIIKSPKNNFSKLFFVDTHCGTGLIKFKDGLEGEYFPGSPFVAALRADQYPFTDYLLSDNDENSIKALSERLKANKVLVGNRDYNPQIMDFNDAVDNAIKKREWGTAFLFFIDSIGYKEIKWTTMKKILNIDTADIIFTFMTYTVERNRAIAETNNTTAQGFDEFFGNSEWRNYNSGQELLELYRRKLESTGKNTYVIEVFKKGENKLYDIIFVSRSTGGSKIADFVSNVLKYIDTEMIHGIFEIISKKTRPITDFMT